MLGICQKDPRFTFGMRVRPTEGPRGKPKAHKEGEDL